MSDVTKWNADEIQPWSLPFEDTLHNNMVRCSFVELYHNQSGNGNYVDEVNLFMLVDAVFETQYDLDHAICDAIGRSEALRWRQLGVGPILDLIMPEQKLVHDNRRKMINAKRTTVEQLARTVCLELDMIEKQRDVNKKLAQLEIDKMKAEAQRKIQKEMMMPMMPPLSPSDKSWKWYEDRYYPKKPRGTIK